MSSLSQLIDVALYRLGVANAEETRIDLTAENAENAEKIKAQGKAA